MDRWSPICGYCMSISQAQFAAIEDAMNRRAAESVLVQSSRVDLLHAFSSLWLPTLLTEVCAETLLSAA